MGRATLFFVFICAAIVIWAYEFSDQGIKTDLSLNCDSKNSILVKKSFYKHPFDFERGDSFGYAIFLKNDEKERPIFNDAFLTVDQPGVMPAWYVSWQFIEKGHYKGPVLTNEFAPLPLNNRLVRVIAIPQRTYDHTKPPPNIDNPPFLNIFLDPKMFTEMEFQLISDCLERNQKAVNRTLDDLGADLPELDRRFYHPLKLGGVVYGPPPYEDAVYQQQIRALWGDASQQEMLPDSGRFTLYRGQIGKGLIDGHIV